MCILQVSRLKFQKFRILEILNFSFDCKISAEVSGGERVVIRKQTWSEMEGGRYQQVFWWSQDIHRLLRLSQEVPRSGKMER